MHCGSAEKAGFLHCHSAFCVIGVYCVDNYWFVEMDKCGYWDEGESWRGGGTLVRQGTAGWGR